MRKLLRFTAPLLLAMLLLFAGAAAVDRVHAEAKHYVCVPCGLPCDKTVFDKPGVCPQCGMALVDEQTAKTAERAHKKVAILIFDGVEIIDYAGPYEVFGAADFDVYTVAATKAPVTTAMGMTVVPKYTLAGAPQPDVLVVPGGGVKATREDAATLKWIRDVAARDQHTLSVCNGAFILASAGLLDGLSATTTFSNLDRLRNEFPKIKVVADQRFVDNGKIITAGGLSAGIDGALHVIARMLGEGTAQKAALDEEYDWRPRAAFTRATLADLLIPHIDQVDLGATGDWSIVRTEGGADRWEMEFRGPSSLTAADLLDRIGRIFEQRGKWTGVHAAATTSSSAKSDWKFLDRNGRPWTGTLAIRSLPGAGREYFASLMIARAG